MSASEASIQAASIKWLRAQGAVCIKLSTQAARGTRGWPDYLVLLDEARCFFVELKAEGRKLTALQAIRKTELESLDHRVYVCHSKIETIGAYNRETEQR